mmetsp:Transcript_13331/g.27635  ORF Transcript_13331/g.27635 Transcript_13331/m.27635 type:complete len:133 (-) Transcript_13331:292-690(-)
MCRGWRFPEYLGSSLVEKTIETSGREFEICGRISRQSRGLWTTAHSQGRMVRAIAKEEEKEKELSAPFVAPCHKTVVNILSLPMEEENCHLQSYPSNNLWCKPLLCTARLLLHNKTLLFFRRFRQDWPRIKY